MALAALAQSNTKIAELMERQTEFNEFSKRNAPRRKKTLKEYLREKPRKRLLHDVYQGGRLVNPAGLSVATIQKLDTFATGKYCDGLIDVVRITDGPKGLNSRIHIMYSNKEIGQRMMFYMRFPTFTSLVDQVVADMAAQGIQPVREPAADPIEEIPEIEE